MVRGPSCVRGSAGSALLEVAWFAEWSRHAACGARWWHVLSPGASAADSSRPLGMVPPGCRDRSAQECRVRGAARSADSPSGHDMPRVVRGGGTFCRLGRPRRTVRDHSASRSRGVATARRRSAARRAGSPSGHDMPCVVRRGGTFCRLGRPRRTVRDHSASRWRGVATDRRRQWARPQTDGRPGTSWHRASRPSGARV